MADVFISYSKKDQAKVERLAKALGEQGLEVFWDRHIDTGADFGQTIESEINAAKKVIVAWSEAAAASKWVRDEAELAQSQGKLVPVSIDGTLGPLGFRQLQTLDLSRWWNGGQDDAIAELAASLGRKPRRQPAPPAETSAEKSGSGMRWFFGAAAVLALIAAAWLGWRGTGGAPAQRGTVTPSGEVGLAVIPFRSLSEDGSDELFADGLSEELLDRLAAVSGLVVPGRSSVFRFKQRAAEPQAMGLELNVDYLVEGTVRRSGDALRITASLIEAASGFTRWSSTFEREMEDLFAIQDDIARAVVSDLLGAISYDEVAKASFSSASPQAHALYLEGRALWRKREPSAADRFQQALKLDPDHALAHAFFAIVRSYLERAPSPVVSQSLAMAVALLPDHPDVLFAEGWVAEMTESQDEAGVAERYQRSLRANPRNVEALYASFRLTGDTTLLESALSMDPAHLPVRTALASQYYARGERSAAASSLMQAYASYPELSPAVLAETAKDAGDFVTFSRLIFTDTARSLSDQWSRSVLALTLADLGAEPEALFLLEEASDSLSRVNSAMFRKDWASYLEAAAGADVPPVFRPFGLAVGYYAMGRFDDGLRELEARWPQVFMKSPELRHGRVGSDGDWVALLGIELLVRAGRFEEGRALAEAMIDWLPEPDTGGSAWRLSFHWALALGHVGREEEAVQAFLRAVEFGFRYLNSYGCEGCVWPAIDEPDSLIKPILGDVRVQQALADIKSRNAEALSDLQARYGTLDDIRALMAEAQD